MLRDQRLTPSARALAGLLVAAGRQGRPRRPDARLPAARLGVSERTVARLLAQLRAYGYIATRQTIGALARPPACASSCSTRCCPIGRPTKRAHLCRIALSRWS